jgi:hypothetical protein
MHLDLGLQRRQRGKWYCGYVGGSAAGSSQHTVVVDYQDSVFCEANIKLQHI